MQSATEILAQIVSDADSFDELRTSVLESHDILIDGLYCLHTGKLIGRFDRSEIEEAIYEEGGIDSDFEELADSLVVRVVASMRPSPALNKPDMGTIREMTQRRPVDALSYLMNRLYGTRHLIRAKGEDTFAPMIERIRTHECLDNLFTKGVNLAPYSHWLLELDSKLNLHDISAPMFDRDRLGKWMVVKAAGLGMTLREAMIHEDFLPCFESWVFARLEEHGHLEAAASRELNWHKGNSMTSAAFIRSYLDNPEVAGRKYQAAAKAKATKLSNRSAKSPRASKLQTQVNQFMDLLDGILQTDTSPAATSNAPVSTPKKKTVLRAGMLFKNRES